MATVKFPYSVKFNGKRYAPNMPIEVGDATEHVKKGAVMVEDKKKKGGRKAKADETTEEIKTAEAVKTEEVKVSEDTTETTEE